MQKQHVKKLLTRRPKIAKGTYLSTGSTLLNLAISGHSRKGFLQGFYYLLVGDSQSGKTFLSLTCLAEASNNPAFKNHRFIHDDVEQGALMDMEYFFGVRVAERLEPPATYSDGTAKTSSTIEEFYYHFRDVVNAGEPFIYILDSMDCLDSEQARDKFDEQKLAYEKGKDAAGSMTDGKAKVNSQNVRGVITSLKGTPNILLVINQTRDNIGFGYKKKTRSGGRALTYYATNELWSSKATAITRTVKSKPYSIGNLCSVKVVKNRVQGRDRTVNIPIYNTYGIDDVESCIDWLLDKKHWKVTKQSIVAPELKFKGTKERLIFHVHENNLHQTLRATTAKVWNVIERACMVNRPGRRYV